jgi:anti-sigma regulatory factor (Ser/Thr protein kinase)
MTPIRGAMNPGWPAAGSGRAHGGTAGTGTVDQAAAPLRAGSLEQSQAPVPVPSSPSAHRAAMPGHWPVRSFLELGALPGAVPCARLHARQIAWELGLARLGHDLELLVSELVTNAAAAARALQPQLPVRQWLLSDTRQIAVVVWDASSHPPLPTPVDENAEGGRGLLLVEAISQRWGWYPAQYTGGKAVWALTGS